MPELLWWGVGAAGGLYVALFVWARPPASLRLGRVGWMALTVLVARAGLLGLGYRLEFGLDLGMAAATTLGSVGFRLNTRVWLVRATREELEDEIRDACARLFMGCEEPRNGHFHLRARNGTAELTLAAVAPRLQFVMLPAGIGERKVELLLSWFSKQHPGPVPRLRIDLARRQS